jgi:hypothetical protein
MEKYPRSLDRNSMKHKITSRRWLIDYLALLLVLILYGTNIYYLINADFAPPMWDEAVHLRDSLVYHNILSNPSQINFKVISDILGKSEQYPLIRPSGYYPPLGPILTSFLYFFFGTSTRVAIMSNMVFLFILIFSIYKIGTQMFNRNTGLLASVLILLFPIVLKHSVVYMPDLPLTAIVAFSIFTILKSDYFRDTKFSVISGFSFGLGMLTKWTYLFFVVGPLFYSVLKAFYAESSRKDVVKVPFYLRKSFRNIGIFVISSVATFGPYYIPILAALIKDIFILPLGVLAEGPNSLFSFASASFYPVALWKDMITPLGSILLTDGLVLVFFSKSRYKTFLLIWALVPYFIFTFMIINKNSRYIMPALVPISLIISSSLCEIEYVRVLGRQIKVKRYAVSVSLILFALLFLREDLRLKHSIVDSSKENWKINEMVSVIEKDITMNKSRQFNNTPMFVGVIPDHYYVNGQTLRYYATLRQLPLNVIKLQNYKGTAFEEFVAKFDRYNYILTKNSSNIPITSFQKSINSFQESINDMHKFFYARVNRFELLKTFNEPDGSEVQIFKRRY